MTAEQQHQFEEALINKMWEFAEEAITKGNMDVPMLRRVRRYIEGRGRPERAN